MLFTPSQTHTIQNELAIVLESHMLTYQALAEEIDLFFELEFKENKTLYLPPNLKIEQYKGLKGQDNFRKFVKKQSKSMSDAYMYIIASWLLDANNFYIKSSLRGLQMGPTQALKLGSHLSLFLNRDTQEEEAALVKGSFIVGSYKAVLVSGRLKTEYYLNLDKSENPFILRAQLKETNSSRRSECSASQTHTMPITHEGCLIVAEKTITLVYMNQTYNENFMLSGFGVDVEAVLHEQPLQSFFLAQNNCSVFEKDKGIADDLLVKWAHENCHRAIKFHRDNQK